MSSMSRKADSRNRDLAEEVERAMRGLSIKAEALTWSHLDLRSEPRTCLVPSPGMSSSLAQSMDANINMYLDDG